MHIDDADAMRQTYDWLMQVDALTLTRLAAEHDSPLETKISELVDSRKDDWQTDIADLADRIDAARKESADECRYAGIDDYCF